MNDSRIAAWSAVWDKLRDILGGSNLITIAPRGIDCALGALDMFEYLINDPDTDLCVRYKATDLERANGSSEYVYIDGELLIQKLKGKLKEKKSA